MFAKEIEHGLAPMQQIESGFLLLVGLPSDVPTSCIIHHPSFTLVGLPSDAPIIIHQLSSIFHALSEARNTYRLLSLNQTDL
jgi:hypothetical protein